MKDREEWAEFRAWVTNSRHQLRSAMVQILVSLQDEDDVLMFQILHW